MSKAMTILLCLMGLLVSSAVFGQEWAGTYTTTIGDADVPSDMKALIGNWELILGDEGQFTMSQNGPD